MENKELETKRHSCAHVMAAAVQQLFPGTKLGIGPAVENGFYYDFDCPHAFTPEDLKTIETKMKELIKARIPFECNPMSKAEAKELFEKRGETYKLELLEELPDGEITVYTTGDLWTSAAARMWSTRVKSIILNFLPSPAHTGAGTKNAPCCSAFTACALTIRTN